MRIIFQQSFLVKDTLVGSHLWQKNNKITWTMHCEHRKKKCSIAGDILGRVLRNANKPESSSSVWRAL